MNKSISQGFRKITHCIFDMDGLLLDTERIYTDIVQTILDDYGKTYTFEVKLSLMGLQTKEVSEKMINTYDLPFTWQEYAKLQRELAAEAMQKAQLMPDTEPVYEEVVEKIAASFGKTYPLDVRMKIRGRTEQDSGAVAIKELQLPIALPEYLKIYHTLCRQSLGNSPLLKGAEKLLRHLHQHNIPFALATSSGEDMVELKTRNHQKLFELFHHKVCGSTDSDVKNGKPAPDIFLVAASRFEDKPSAENCLVFEDAPNGVEAAYAAGMQCVMVPDVRVPKELCQHATLVLKSLQDFKPQDFGLVPY